MSRIRLSASRDEHRKPRRRRWERLNSKGRWENIEHPTPNIEFVKPVSSVVKKVFAVFEDEDENDDEEELKKNASRGVFINFSLLLAIYRS
jgi:hypothetical protein